MVENDQKKEQPSSGGQSASEDFSDAAAEAWEKTVVQEREEGTPQRLQYPPPYAVVVDGPRTGARFPLKDGENIIGRSQGNEIRLDDQSVSRQHAEILKTASGWSVKDLGSKNGTFVNGKPIVDAVVIGHKDVIKTGIYQLRLITQQTSLEEELTLPPELSVPDRTVFVMAPPESVTGSIHKSEVEGVEEEGEAEGKPEDREAPETTEEGEPVQLPFYRVLLLRMLALLERLRQVERRKILLFCGLGVMLIAALFLVLPRFLPSEKAKTEEVAAEEALPEEAAEEMTAPEAPERMQVPPSPPGETQQAGAMTSPPAPPSPTMPSGMEAPSTPPPSAQGQPTTMPAGAPTPGMEGMPSAAGPEAASQPVAGQPSVPTDSPIAAPMDAGMAATPPSPAMPPQPAGMPQATPPAQMVSPEAMVASGQQIPLFLDFASSPMPATVTFQGREVGTTPLRINVQLEPGLTFQAKALFQMPEINQSYTQEVEFTTEAGTSVIPVLFRAPIGMIKVENMPRDVELYLEGKFSYDRFTEQTAKLRDIVMQKPIYIPYGQYVLELRKSRQLGETSPTVVSDIIYRREFTIEEESPTFTIDLDEKVLKSFPVKVRSEPPNADVSIDGKSVGKTPFEGNFPLGEHRLVIRKEGYFEYAEDLKVDINTPFVANVKLKTSISGAHINNARLALNRQLYQEAINELAQALTSNPVPSEMALANFLLGKSYFGLNDLDRALNYFELARQGEEQRYPAMLGMVNVYAVRNEMGKALPLLVEVLLKAEDEQVKREANDLFQKVSPFRSVLYVYSEPSGATVTVNDKTIQQKTPVILHELPLGSYRLKIEKTGFLPTDLNLSLSVNEFNPVIVKLKPIPE